MDRIDPVHVRVPAGAYVIPASFPVQADTFCGRSGGSVSYRHVQERPEQIAVLPMCEDCMAGCRGPMTIRSNP